MDDPFADMVDPFDDMDGLSPQYIYVCAWLVDVFLYLSWHTPPFYALVFVYHFCVCANSTCINQKSSLFLQPYVNISIVDEEDPFAILNEIAPSPVAKKATTSRCFEKKTNKLYIIVTLYFYALALPASTLLSSMHRTVHWTRCAVCCVSFRYRAFMHCNVFFFSPSFFKKHLSLIRQVCKNKR